MSKKRKTKKEKNPLTIERQYEVSLPSGQKVTVETRYGIKQKIDVKAKIPIGGVSFGGFDVTPAFKNFRKDKEIVTDTIRVSGLEMSIRFKDGEILEARSCCKPPDVFRAAVGKRLALGRIFIQDMGLDPSKLNFEQKANGRRVPILKSGKLQQLEKEYKEASEAYISAEDLDIATNKLRNLAEKVKKERQKPINGRKPRLSEDDRKFLTLAVLRNGKPVFKKLGLEKAKQIVGDRNASAILGVSEQATLDEIQRVFREIKKNPKRDFEDKQAAFEVLREIKE